MKYCLIALLTIGLARTAGADDILLTNGGALVGIAQLECDRWVLRTRCGNITLPNTEVKSVAPGRTLLHDYDDRLAALFCGCPTASEIFELAVWAQEQGLTRYVNSLLTMTLEVDPDHPEARCMLGFSMHRGGWLSSRGRDALRASAELKPMGATLRASQVRVRPSRSLETTPYTLGIPMTQAMSTRSGSSGGYSFWQGAVPTRNLPNLPLVR